MHTNNIGLKYLLQNQASPEVTINEAFEKLDALIFNTPKEILDTLPEEPHNGDIYICSEDHVNANNLTAYINNSWHFFAPQNGMVVSLQSTGKQIQFLNNKWAEIVRDNENINYLTHSDLTPYASNSEIVNANYIINGNFDIWQRGILFIGTTNRYFADRWCGRRLDGTSQMQVTQINNDVPIGSNFAMRIGRMASDKSTSSIGICQIFDNEIIKKLAGQIITVSAKIRLGTDFQNANDKIKMQVVSGTVAGQGGNPFAFASGSQVVGFVETPNVRNIWHDVSFTVEIPARIEALMVSFVNENPNGIGSMNDFFDISQVKLEISQKKTKFVPQSFSNELASCQYFYERIFADVDGVSMFVGFAENEWLCRMPFGYQYKRAIPAISASAQNIFSIVRYGTVPYPTTTTINFARVSRNYARIDAKPNSPLTPASTVMLGMTKAGSFVEIDAEIY